MFRIESISDTIANISTALGNAAISIVRLSGSNALSIIEQVFIRPNLRPLDKKKAGFLQYGKIVDPKTQQVLDEVLAVWMPKTRSYTREDLVEIQCHGGKVIPKLILTLILTLGARLSQPGEFTQRAYLHGRIDLTQAEAIEQMIRAQNESQALSSLSQLSGRLSRLIQEIQKPLLKMVAHCEAKMNYSDEAIETINLTLWQQSTLWAQSQLQQILKEHQRSDGREGFNIAIVGKVNVGKSSLLNHLLEQNRALVSAQAGTTRDYIEARIFLENQEVILADTAGFRTSTEELETQGQVKSWERLEAAELILWVLDQNTHWTPEEQQILTYCLSCKKKNRSLVVVNKKDLSKRLDTRRLKPFQDLERYYEISLKTNEGLDVLKAGLKKLSQRNVKTWHCTLRQERLLEASLKSLTNLLEGLKQNLPEDLLVLDIEEALQHLGEITGEGGLNNERILDEVFRNFCIGK